MTRHATVEEVGRAIVLAFENHAEAFELDDDREIFAVLGKSVFMNTPELERFTESQFDAGWDWLRTQYQKYGLPGCEPHGPRGALYFLSGDVEDFKLVARFNMSHQYTREENWNQLLEGLVGLAVQGRTDAVPALTAALRAAAEASASRRAAIRAIARLYNISEEEVEAQWLSGSFAVTA